MSNLLHSEHAENQLLGILISDASKMKDLVGYLEPTDFFLLDNQILFAAMINSYEKHGSTDSTFLLEELGILSDRKKDDWLNYFSNLILEKGLVTNIESYVGLIKEKKQSRDLKTTLDESALRVSKGQDSITDLIGDVEAKMQDITRQKGLKDFEKISVLTEEYLLKLSEIEENGITTGLKTGINDLDKLTGGLQPGQFVIVAARPSMGKTAFALHIARHVASKKSVGFFSLEMPADQLILRMISADSSLTSQKITGQTGEPLSQNAKVKLDVSKEKIKSLNMRIDDSPSLSISELVWKARKAKATDGLDLIIIDYLQLINASSNNVESRQQALSEISRQLKALARELEIPVIALSQLSRKVESRENKRPMMSDIRESGAIEQDADIIMFLYRDVYYKETQNKKEANADDFEVLVKKNRNGEVKDLHMKINLSFGQIHS